MKVEAIYYGDVEEVELTLDKSEGYLIITRLREDREEMMLNIADVEEILRGGKEG